MGPRTAKKSAKRRRRCLPTLPDEILGEIGKFLPSHARRAARLVCKSWAASITTGVEAITAYLECGQAPMEVDTRLHAFAARHPALQTLALVVSRRATQVELDTFLSALTVLRGLNSVVVSTVGAAAHLHVPQRRAELTALAGLSGLTSLALVGDSALTELEVDSLAALPRLRAVTCSPWYLMPRMERDQESARFNADRVLGDAQLRRLCLLDGLEELNVHVHEDVDAHVSCAAMLAMPRLRGLQLRGAHATPALLWRVTQSGAAARAVSHLTLMELVVSADLSCTSVRDCAAAIPQLRTLRLLLMDRANLAADLATLAGTPCLQWLWVEASTWTRGAVDSLAALTGLAHITINRPALLEPLQLASLAALSSLQRLEVMRKEGPASVTLPTEEEDVKKLASSWTQLTCLRFSGLNAADCSAAQLLALGRRLPRLAALHLLTTPGAPLVLLRAQDVPAGLQTLELAGFHVADLHRLRAPDLTGLVLNSCSVRGMGQLLPPPDAAPCLSKLVLDSCEGLVEEHLREVAAHTCLRSVNVSAEQSACVFNSSLALLAPLPRLRHLVWVVGDLFLPDVHVLCKFTGLHTLSLALPQYNKMVWSGLLPHVLATSMRSCSVMVV